MPYNEDTNIRRILVIDDNPDIFNDFQMVLHGTESTSDLDHLNAELFGKETNDFSSVKTYDLDYASQGKEGYEKVKSAVAQNQPYRLAFVDMRMPPGWDGLETIEHIWQVDPDIQIVICTAYSDYSWDEIIEKVGSSDNLLILKKPFDVIEVAQLASALTEKWHLSRQASMKMEELDRKVEQRTKELTTLNTQLQTEIAERKMAEECLSRMALHDSLTGLPNRCLFQDRLSLSIADTKRTHNNLAVLFIDIDDFKRINDTLGHSVGDLLLKAVAENIENCIRNTDTVSHKAIFDIETSTVARIGGDEFTVLLTNLQTSQAAAKVARRIMKAVSHPFQLGSNEIYMTLSIGISISPEDGDDASYLLKNADTALYHAKSHGKNNFQYYKNFMNEFVQKSLVMENALRKTIDADEIMAYYQPRIDTRTGNIISAETLARWKKPDGSFVSPAEFIPVAEDTGLIIPLGERILKTACAQNASWQKPDRPPLSISVNISVKQFQHKNFLKTISKTLADSSLDPRYLELEITENILMQNVKSTINILNELKNMGIRLAIDDFGTGYSSLNYLIRFPLNIIKIDISFIKHITEKPVHATIVKAIISMAHSLNLKVVAEGVETEQQLDILRKLDCDEIQGYYYSHPLPAKEFTALLEKSMHQPLENAYVKNNN